MVRLSTNYELRRQPVIRIRLSAYLIVRLYCMKYEVCHVMIVMSVVISVYVIISVINHRVTQGYSCLRWSGADSLICSVSSRELFL